MPVTKTIIQISKKLQDALKSENALPSVALAKEEALQTAWALVEHITKKTKTELLVQTSFSLTPPMQQELDNLIFEITTQNKPLAYILGYVPFLGLKILVEEPVLIPRPETEEWTQKLIDHLKTCPPKPLPAEAPARRSLGEGWLAKAGWRRRILDLCTGTGCIGLALANALPKSQVFATDISKEVIRLGKKNKKLNQIKNIEFVESDLFQNIDKNLKFDLIVTNPPYIAENDYVNLEPKVKDWEDPVAFLAGEQGLEIIKKIVSEAPARLESKKMNPELWVEIGWNQANEVKKLFAEAGFKNIEVLKDFGKKDRVVRGIYHRSS